ARNGEPRLHQQRPRNARHETQTLSDVRYPRHAGQIGPPLPAVETCPTNLKQASCEIRLWVLDRRLRKRTSSSPVTSRNGVSRRPRRMQKPFNLADSQVIEKNSRPVQPQADSPRMANFPVPEVRESWILS